MVNMNTTRRWPWLPTAGCGLLLATLVGCQTQVPGTQQTLPSGHYLEHPPQYVPPSPAFPLPREEATQLSINARAGGPPAPAVLPPPVPGAPAAPPAPAVLPPPGGP
jgi:hypothetical protein